MNLAPESVGFFYTILFLFVATVNIAFKISYLLCWLDICFFSVLRVSFSEVFMKFVNKISVMYILSTVMLSAASYAGTVTTGQLEDSYVGARYNYYNNDDYRPNDNAANYDTHWMKIDKSDQGILTVEVNSNFIGYDSYFKLGDLFLMDANNYQMADTCTSISATNGTNVNARGCNENSYSEGTNKWEYAFDLGLDLANLNQRNSTNDYAQTAGTLRAIETSGNVTDVNGGYHLDVNTSSQLKGSGVRGWQIVDVKSTADQVSNPNGTWSTDVSEKLLTMTFDISGTALMGAEQIALRWAMSCANDIIEVVTNFTSPNPPTPVPEPSTFMLIL